MQCVPCIHVRVCTSMARMFGYNSDTKTHTHLYTCIIIFVFKKFSHTSPPPSHGRCQLPLSSPRDRLIPYRTPSVMTPTQKLEPTHTCLLNPGHAYMHICLHIICIYTHTYTFTLNKCAYIYIYISIYTYSCLCSALRLFVRLIKSSNYIVMYYLIHILVFI